MNAILRDYYIIYFQQNGNIYLWTLLFITCLSFFYKMPIEFNAETNILTAILYAQTLDRDTTIDSLTCLVLKLCSIYLCLVMAVSGHIGI